MYSEELYNEMKKQGASMQTCDWIANRFQTKEQEHAMMEYLKSIAKITVSEVQVIIMGRTIAQM